jgi:methylisocitrate lyase
MNLRQLLRDPAVLTLPGVWNGLTARAVKQAGFDACYVGGSTVTASSGVPDVGLVGLEGFCRIIREVTAASALPLIVDADTGFGEEEMVRRTVLEYHSAGASGLHIEDQEFPKRCGHLGGKTLIECDRMVAKLERAVAARETIREYRGGDMIVCARTDARGVTGMDDAIERAKRYIDAGADMIFPEGLRDLEEFGEFARAVEPMRNSDGSGPFLLANMTVRANRVRPVV